MTQTTHNPFFFSYNTPFETPPFNEIKTNISNRLSMRE